MMTKGHYLLREIDPAVWEAAKAKAALHKPPLSMKWVLNALLERWAGVVAAEKPKPDRGIQARRRRVRNEAGKLVHAEPKPLRRLMPRPRRTKPTPADMPANAGQIRPVELPDLGDSF